MSIRTDRVAPHAVPVRAGSGGGRSVRAGRRRCGPRVAASFQAVELNSIPSKLAWSSWFIDEPILVTATAGAGGTLVAGQRGALWLQARDANGNPKADALDDFFFSWSGGGGESGGGRARPLGAAAPGAYEVLLCCRPSSLAVSLRVRVR